MIKRFSVSAVALGLLARLAWGEPASKAMVLESTGSAQLKSGRTQDKVLTGQIWREGDSVVVNAKGQLTVLVLGKGERLTISGPATVTVGSAGVTVRGGSTKGLSAVQPKLALTGENHRQIGGNAIRSELKPAQLSSKLGSVEVNLDSRPVVTVTRPAADSPGKSVVFSLESDFVRPDLTGDLDNVVRGGARRSYASIPAEAVVANGVSTYQATMPEGEPGSLVALRVTDEQSGEELLYTRLYYPVPGDGAQVEQARKDAEEWARREPRNPGPWLVYAQVLEEKGLLSRALEAVSKALALRPHDEGLLQMKARLQMDLGDYASAAKSVKAARSQGKAKSG